MADVEVRLNLSGVRAVLSSEGVAADLGRRAKAIESRANGMAERLPGQKKEPYKAKTDRHTHIAAAHVWSSRLGAVDNARHNTLLKSIDAGRG